MKTKRFLQGFATFAIIVLFAGCTNILDSKTAEKSKENTSVSINFNANGRYISAGSFELSRITSWKVIFKSDSGEKDIELAWSSDTSDTSSNSSSPSLNYSEGVLTAKLIPTGIYDITLEGSYSEGNGTVTVSGTKEDVTVSSETAKNNITVIVGLKKDSSVNGSLELYFNTTGIPDYASALHVTLKNIQIGNIEYSTDSTAEKTLDFSPSDSSGYTLTGADIAPGWYKLEFYHSDSVKIEIPGDKMMVEIASGIKTTDSDIKLSGTSVKRYYATNDNSESDQKMNGLSVSSRKNLTALLETLTKNWPDVPEVDIFMDKVPEIDIKTFNELKKTLGDSKNLSIYLGESTPSIIHAYFNFGTNAVNTVLSGSAWLVATDGNKNFEITNLSVGQDQVNSIDITLKNGACLDVTGEMSFSGNLNIYAIKDSEDGTVQDYQDNFASYITTPFFSSFSNTDVDSFSLREYASKEVSEHNTIISVPKEAGVEFCIKPASMKGITAESSDNLSIEAYYSSGSDKNVYVSGSAIPYESSSLEIKLNPKGIEIKNCLWYLNGESFDDSVSELTGFVPTQASSLNVDGKNVISCFASVGEKLYLCEFNFTFKTPSRSAAVWFSGEGNNYSMKQIYDYTDSTATEIIKENLTSKYYCFDKNYNLWIAVPGDALTLNKYSMKVSTDSYSTDPDLTKQLSEITSLSDMCYDCVNSYIYLLVSEDGDASVSVYDVSTGSEPAKVASAQIDMSNLKTTTFTNIAVNGNDFYFADKLCNVYKATGTVTSDSIAIEPPTLVINLDLIGILEGYDSSKYDGTYDSISITDLQFGDGLGYGAENVYALIKESSWGLGFTHSDYFYSRGALVKINATDDSTNIFGWTSEQKELKYTNNGDSYTDYYYIPDGADPTAFFGPEKFCAVVPKKIVVVDDGFYWKAGDTGDGKIKNKDSIVEFDIAGSTLTRGAASISASFNIGATDYYSGIVEN